MANLHIVRSSGFTHNKLRQCLQTLMAADQIILIDDGVYNASHPDMMPLLNTHKVYALQDHIQARGLTPVPSGIELCQYDDFVALTIGSDKVITWQ
ncbi:sulfurtransferase complex subunit TusB [Thalassotalea litorea]|uniref:Sulfurtransferase complex subunit TusB n=1 Tax=Thalassotalea litorea TaxID=2020715 RepID=A0A5R9INQ3_9GAMM|nr:sulfurtransferase complex subunit TusB [Thalassotalea litorea]